MTDTTNATTEAVEAAIIKAYKDELCSQGWWDFKIGEEVLLGFAARAVLSVPRVAAGLELLEAVAATSNLMVDRFPVSPTDHQNAGLAAGWNQLLARLRVIAGINDTEERS